MCWHSLVPRPFEGRKKGLLAHVSKVFINNIPDIAVSMYIMALYTEK